MSFIQAVVDRFENEQAVLLLPDGQELIVKKKYLPGGAAAGMWLRVVFKLDKNSTRKKNRQAEELLSKVLNNS